MRRDTFLRSMAALAAAGALPLTARAAANIKMMIPANPGGGWDTTGRALGKALQEAGASSVSYDNKGGAAGAIGLAQFVNASKGDPNALMTMGAVMVGGIITGKPPVSLTQATPIARLTSEYNVFVLPASSPLKTMKDVVEQLKKDPGSVKWGGGSRGSTEHIAAAMIAQAAGVDPAKINYVAFRGGGEAVAAILGGNVSVGGSGYSEFQQYIEAGKMRAIGMTGAKRFKSFPDAPSVAELGYPKAQNAGWSSIAVPAGTPPEVVEKLAQIVQEALKDPAVVQYYDANDNLALAELGPDKMRDFIAKEIEKFKAVVERSGATAD